MDIWGWAGPMNIFGAFRPMLRIASELRRIADVLEYFAQVDARDHNRMFLPARRGLRALVDQSELLHTDSEAVQALRAEEDMIFDQRGYPALEALDAQDN